MVNGLNTSSISGLATPLPLPLPIRTQGLRSDFGLIGRQQQEQDLFESANKDETLKEAPKETVWQQIKSAFHPLLNMFRALIGLPALERNAKLRKQAIIKHELAHALSAYLSGAQLQGIYLEGSKGFEKYGQPEQQAFIRFTTNESNPPQQQAALYIAGLASGLQPGSLDLKPSLQQAVPNTKQQAKLRQHLLLGADTDVQQLLGVLKDNPSTSPFTKKESAILKREGEMLNQAIEAGTEAPDYEEATENSLTQLLRTPSLQRLHQQTYRLLNSIPEASWQAMIDEIQTHKGLEGHEAIIDLFETHIGKSKLRALKTQWQQQT